jgi:hypothetical protein
LTFTLPATTESALQTWAAQKRMVYVRMSEPVASVLGRIRDERVAAGEGAVRIRQRWPEVYTGDGLVVQLIVATMPELPRLALTFHRVLRFPWHVPIAAQVAEIGIPRREYWRQLNAAEHRVDSALSVLSTIPESAHSAFLRSGAGLRAIIA